MDFKFYRKNVRHGRMSQKSYERWVMNDGVDPEDGDGGQQNSWWADVHKDEVYNALFAPQSQQLDLFTQISL